MNSGETTTRQFAKYETATAPLLEHLARYRLTVFAAIRRLPHFAGWSDKEINALLRACQRQRLIGWAPLCPGARYWHVDLAGARRWGLPEQRSGPLSEPAKLRSYARLRFCCLSESPRHLLTATELEQHFPTLHRPGLPCGYCFDPTDAGGLRFVRVDAAGHSRWDRVIQSLRQDISTHCLHAGFRQLVAVGRFQVTLITPLPQKAVRISAALTALPDVRRIPVEVIAMPELLPLIGTGRKEVRTR